MNFSLIFNNRFPRTIAIRLEFMVVYYTDHFLGKKKICEKTRIDKKSSL